MSSVPSAGKGKSDNDSLRSLSLEGRKLIGSAIIDGLISPSALSFGRLATEGGDYDQGQGPYTQSGGGNHSQEGGGYNQSAITFGNNRDFVNVINVLDMIQDRLQQ